MRDAVIVEAFMTVKQANALADWVAASGKNLTTIFITHGHGDHWFGTGTLLERFPNARVVATPNVSFGPYYITEFGLQRSICL